MSGNVWEWTRSLWGDYRYPENARARHEREDPTAEGPRVLRGGAFDGSAWFVRCAFRFSDFPDFRVSFIGFRVVVSPFFSER